jgi:hypothetical protein
MTTVNNTLGITNERECEILEKLNKFVNEKEVKQIASIIQEIETWDDFSRIEKSYAIFLFGMAVEKNKDVGDD